MSDQSDETKKGEFLNAVGEARQAAQDVVKRGQECVRQGRLIDEIGSCAEDIARSVPDDSYVDPHAWNRGTAAWRAQARLSEHLAPSTYLPLQFATATSTMTASSFVLPQVFTRPLSIETQQRVDYARNRLADIVGSSTWDREVEQDFRRLGLEVTRPDRKSALQLLAASHEALRTPSGIEPEPVAVLIPLREAIERVLADLLPRRPRQEPTQHIGDKVRSICAQLGRPSLPKAEIDRLAEEAGSLHDELSAAKQRALGTPETRTLFVKGRAFLKAVLSATDENRFRM